MAVSAGKASTDETKRESNTMMTYTYHVTLATETGYITKIVQATSPRQANKQAIEIAREQGYEEVRRASTYEIADSFQITH